MGGRILLIALPRSHSAKWKGREEEERGVPFLALPRKRETREEDRKRRYRSPRSPFLSPSKDLAEAAPFLSSVSVLALLQLFLFRRRRIYVSPTVAGRGFSFFGKANSLFLSLAPSGEYSTCSAVRVLSLYGLMFLRHRLADARRLLLLGMTNEKKGRLGCFFYRSNAERCTVRIRPRRHC